MRDVIRNTWLSVSKENHNFKALFVMGNKNLNSKEEYEIAAEKSRYDDILLLPIFDSYKTLTNKVGNGHILKFVLTSNYQCRCSEALCSSKNITGWHFEIQYSPLFHFNFFSFLKIRFSPEVWWRHLCWHWASHWRITGARTQKPKLFHYFHQECQNREGLKKEVFFGKFSQMCEPTHPRVFVRFGKTKGEIRV